jgi:hypothetical protein
VVAVSPDLPWLAEAAARDSIVLDSSVESQRVSFALQRRGRNPRESSPQHGAPALSTNLPKKVQEQMTRAGLPTAGTVPFVPRLITNRRGDAVIEKAEVMHGPKKGKRGYVDTQGRIWIKDRAYAGDPDHWDVQIDAGLDYFRVDLDGDLLP